MQLSEPPISPHTHLNPHSKLRSPLWTIQIGGGCFDCFSLQAVIKIYCPAWATCSLQLTGLSHSVFSTDHGVLRGPICDIDSWLWFVLPRLEHTGCDLRCVMEVTITVSGHTFLTTCFLSLQLFFLCNNVDLFDDNQNFYLNNRLQTEGICWHYCFCHSFVFFYRYIRSERSIILLNFCLSIICSNILILVGQTQTHNVVSAT